VAGDARGVSRSRCLALMGWFVDMLAGHEGIVVVRMDGSWISK
jgi:hypothetical protein